MKNNLITSTLIGLLVGSSAFAEYKNIPQDELNQYKTATIIAGQKSDLTKCTETGLLQDRSIEDYIKNADSAKINESAKQPILIFEKSPSDQNPLKAITTIVSTPDYRNLVSVKVEELGLSDVNVGDLRNPHIVKAYVVKSTAECVGK